MAKNVYAIVLAAGSASRFGGTKQIAEIDGQTLVFRAVQLANDTCGDRTVVVVGHDRAAVVTACAGTQGFIVVNERYRDGLATSIARAVSAVRDVASAVVVLLADQPLVSREHAKALVDAWSGSAFDIVATSFAGTHGPPVLFPSGCFDDLAAMQGDKGGKHLLDDERFNVRFLAFDAAATDIDTPADLTQI